MGRLRLRSVPFSILKNMKTQGYLSNKIYLKLVTFDPAVSKSRDFYGLLISCKATESRGFTKLKSKFSIDDVETKKASSLIRSCICEKYVQCFQFKILNDILFTNSRLAKIGLIKRLSNLLV